MGDEIDAVDQYGNRYKARRVGGGSGCFDGLIIVIGIIAVLVLGTGLGVGWLWNSAHNYFTYHIWESDTNQAIQYATVTAEASLSTPFGGRLILNDPLQDNSMGYHWEESNDNKGDACQFTSGAYHVSIAQLGSNSCIAEAPTFDNFAYQVSLIPGNAQIAGIMFRLHREQNSSGEVTKLTGYEFDLRNGYYDFRVDNGTESIELTSGGIPNTMNFNDNQPNQIAVVAKGNKFDFYVNYQHLASVSDSTFSSGQIGFLVGASSSSSHTEVVFSDAKVWKL